MNKTEIQAALSLVATILEILGDNPFKIKAYQTAAETVKRLDGDIESLAKSGSLTKIKGIGQTIAANITELIDTGTLELLDELKASLPSGLLDLLRVPGLGPKRIRALHTSLGVTNLGELEYACIENRLVDLPGFGAKLQQNVLKGLEQLKKYAGKCLLSIALDQSAAVLEKLKTRPGIENAVMTGALRRREETIDCLEFLISTDSPVTESELLTEISQPETNLQIRCVTPEVFGSALFYTTGNHEHISGVERLGVAISPDLRREEDLYKSLGLSFIPPELRTGKGEIEAALSGTLPTLVEEKDIKGIFHVHTNYSDGAASIEEMAEAAKALGYTYLGIADHSLSAAYAGGLSVDEIIRQHREIDELNTRLSNFRIFKGIETDILPDGSIDYDESILSRFDFVIASVHSGFNMTEDAMTRRILRAIENPHVTMLGHPTGRLLLAREPYRVDMSKIMEAAAINGKILELNAHPYRLDLSWENCRRAKELGIMISINPDSHSTSGYRDIAYGVMTARKGWLECGDILNTKTLEGVTEWLERNKK